MAKHCYNVVFFDQLQKKYKKVTNIEILNSATKKDSNGVGVGGETEAGEHKARLPTWKTFAIPLTSLNP